jgi:hypothetical protein
MSARACAFFAAVLLASALAATGCGSGSAGEADLAHDADAVSDVAPEIGPDTITLRDADASVPPDAAPDAAKDLPPQPDLTPPPALVTPCACLWARRSSSTETTTCRFGRRRLAARPRS